MKTLTEILLIGIIVLGIVCLAAADNISSGVEISEIMYDSPQSYGDNGGEWIEIYNDTGTTLDITGWILNVGSPDTQETLSQRIPSSGSWGDISQIPDGGFAVISEPASSVDFDTLYPPDGSTPVAVTGSAISLSNDGETIILQDATQTVTYQNFAYPDNVTDSAMNKHVIFGDEDDPLMWGPASSSDGTPGYMDAPDQSLPVVLSSFTAVRSNGSVILLWRTETEIDHVGWNIYRSEKKDGKFQKINDKIKSGAEGNSAMPRDYQFADKDVVPGRQYYYFLEDIDVFGNRDKSTIIGISKGKVQLKKSLLSITWGAIKKKR